MLYFFSMRRRSATPTLFPYTTLFRSTEGLTLHATSLETALNDANAAAKSWPIGTALSEFSKHCSGEVGDMIGLGASAVKGAGDATRHYANGNLEMAAEAQSNAGDIDA